MLFRSVVKNQQRDQVIFLDLVTSKLAANGVASDALQWNAHRKDDGQWVIRLNYPNRDGLGDAVWFFDMTKRTIVAEDEGAAWIMGESAPSVKAPEPELNHGLVYSNPTVTINSAPTPRLSVIRENEDQEDGVKKRASVPSWDEIMFGKKATDEDSDR